MHKNPSPDRLATLGNVELFQGLTRKQLVRVAALVTPVDVEAGCVLTTEGTPGRQVFIVVSGRAEVTVAGRPVATVGPGEIVGEIALLDRQLRTATVTALEPMRVLVAEPRSFATLLEEPGIVRKVLEAEVDRLRAADSAHAALASASPA